MVTSNFAPKKHSASRESGAFIVLLRLVTLHGFYSLILKPS